MNQRTTLYYQEGSSDKVYEVFIEPKDDGCIVRFAYGRRGTTLQTGVKTPEPVSAEDAVKIFDWLVKQKVAKGYRIGESTGGQVSAGCEGEDSGIRCQLLNPVDESEVESLLGDSRWCAQEKYDGRRMLVRKTGTTVTGINRRGLFIPVPAFIAEAALEIPFDFLIDGEAIGDRFHAFDLLEFRNEDLRPVPYIDRLTYMFRWIDTSGGIAMVSTALLSSNKVTLYLQLKKRNAEGVVFKDVRAAYTGGRPASGGSQLKLKFHATASFIVGAVHPKKRSVSLGLIDEMGSVVSAGNVTIPPNHAIPETGTVVEVRFLYAFRESGSVYQPVYLGRRDDIDLKECVTAQLKYKPSTGEDEAA
ncbi:MAG: WGR domain-containing protein [Akkermansiaceae bacterium]|nr:WGR domain-containing protein [Akkermansiaceae bacterium]